jgi:hypothetical protein
VIAGTGKQGKFSGAVAVWLGKLLIGGTENERNLEPALVNLTELSKTWVYVQP